MEVEALVPTRAMTNQSRRESKRRGDGRAIICCVLRCCLYRRMRIKGKWLIIEMINGMNV